MVSLITGSVSIDPKDIVNHLSRGGGGTGQVLTYFPGVQEEMEKYVCYN